MTFWVISGDVFETGLKRSPSQLEFPVGHTAVSSALYSLITRSNIATATFITKKQRNGGWGFPEPTAAHNRL